MKQKQNNLGAGGPNLFSHQAVSPPHAVMLLNCKSLLTRSLCLRDSTNNTKMVHDLGGGAYATPVWREMTVQPTTTYPQHLSQCRSTLARGAQLGIPTPTYGTV